MQIHPLSELGGVEVFGVDLTQRSAEQDDSLRQLFDTQGLVVFRGQNLTKQQLVAAGAPFGGTILNRAATSPDPEAPGISVLSTRGAGGDIIPEDPDKLVSVIEWHSDEGYITTPNRGKILYAVQVPEEGGMTGFIDGQRTYAALPEAMKQRIENLHVIQSWRHAQAAVAADRKYRLKGADVLADDRFVDVAYPLVFSHPWNGEKVLNLPPLWAAGIVELPGQEGQDLLDELLAHLTQKKFQYWHRYQPGDAVLWDNFRFLHAASGTPGRYVRIVWTIALKAELALGRVLEKSAA